MYYTNVKILFFFLELVPPDVEAEARRLYLGGGELLRVFWQCFQPTRNAIPDAEQVCRAHEALQRFRMARVKPFEVNIIFLNLK